MLRTNVKWVPRGGYGIPVRVMRYERGQKATVRDYSDLKKGKPGLFNLLRRACGGTSVIMLRGCIEHLLPLHIRHMSYSSRSPGCFVWPMLQSKHILSAFVPPLKSQNGLTTTSPFV